MGFAQGAPMADRPFTRASTYAGHLLRRCHQISVALFIRNCEARELTQLQYVTLTALEEIGSLDQQPLGGMVALDRNTIALVVRRMAAMGWVVRQRNPEDRRYMLITLTDEGRQARRDAEADVRQTQEDLLSPLTAEQRAQFLRCLQLIADHNNEFSRAPVSMLLTGSESGSMHAAVKEVSK